MKQKNTKVSQAKGKKPATGNGFRPLVITLVTIVVALVAGLAAWAGWDQYQDQKIEQSQDVVNAKFKNIELVSDNYQDEYLQAHVTYVKTENQAINKDLREKVDAIFLPCKDAGVKNRSSVTYDCLASPEITFATDAYLEITYSFRNFPGKGPNNSADTWQISSLYNRKTGKQLGIADLFKPDAGFVQKLSDETRSALNDKFNTAYYSKGISKDAMTQATSPDPKNFTNFLFTTAEKLDFIYQEGTVAPASEGTVHIEVSTDDLYDMFNETTIDVFLPKLKEQKQAAARLAAAAAKTAADEQAAQQKLGSNRDNIDCTKQKCIALTYDDGPYAPYGDRLLDILKQKDAVATFFMVGNRVAAYASELPQVVAGNNEIGNHSWDHSDLTTLSDAQIDAQIQQTNQAIYNASGVYPKLMRPPYGAVDARTVAQINMPLAFWSVDTLDWKYRDADVVYQRAIAGAKPGAVILMHEIHGTTIDAAPRIIDTLQQQGYTLVTVSELFGINKDNYASFIDKKLFGTY